MKITDIRFERVEGLFSGQWKIEERQVGALDLYPEYRRRGVAVGGEFPRGLDPGAPSPIHGLYMHIETDASITGTLAPSSPTRLCRSPRACGPTSSDRIRWPPSACGTLCRVTTGTAAVAT